jgi:hypothetical protein
VNKTELKPFIARAVLRAPDINPKTEDVSAHEVAFTLRPSWSKVGRYETALPGGKIESQDFWQLVTESQFADPDFVPSLGLLIAAGLKTVERELFDELQLIATGLFFVDSSTNQAGWTTFSYAADLKEKPELRVKRDSAGAVWMDEQRIINGRPRLLSGHLAITRRALKALEKKRS